MWIDVSASLVIEIAEEYHVENRSSNDSDRSPADRYDREAQQYDDINDVEAVMSRSIEESCYAGDHEVNQEWDEYEDLNR